MPRKEKTSPDAANESEIELEQEAATPQEAYQDPADGAPAPVEDDPVDYIDPDAIPVEDDEDDAVDVNYEVKAMSEGEDEKPIPEEAEPAPVMKEAPAKKAVKSTPTRAARAAARAKAEERERAEAITHAQIANESALRTAVHNGHIFTGVIAGVEELKDEDGKLADVAAIVMLEKTFKVIIPYDQIFFRSPVKPEEFNDLQTTSDRYNYIIRKRRFIQRMIDSTIYFCLTAWKEDGDDFYLLGSRIKAMTAMRRNFFGRDNPRYKIGDVLSTKVTAVNPTSIVVHIGGMDVIIQKNQLTRRYFRDLHDGYAVGQEVRAELTNVKLDDAGNVVAISLNPIRVELAEAKTRYHLLKDNGRTKGVISGLREGTAPDGHKVSNMYAWLPNYELPARIVRMHENMFGHEIGIGTRVLVRVIKDGHRQDGYLLVEAEYDYGVVGAFSSGVYRN